MTSRLLHPSSFILFFLLFFVFFTGQAHAQATDTLTVANRLYEHGNYAESSRLYQELVTQGYSDPALFHNLGNAYMQQDEIGRAIVNYKRVLRIDPRNADSRANLAQAESSVVSQFPTAENQSITDLLLTTTDYATRTQISSFALGLWLLWGAVYLLYRRVWHTGFMRLSLLLLTTGVIISAAVFFTITWADRTQPEAIIVVPQADVYAEANNADRVLFALYDGTAVHITDHAADWTNITLAGSDLSGWVASNALEEVVVD